MNKSKEIINRLQDAGIRYWAGDNISEVLQEGDNPLCAYFVKDISRQNELIDYGALL